MSIMTGQVWEQEQEIERSILNHTQEAENYMWGKAINTQSLPQVTFPPSRLYFQKVQ